jgi:hypothetical protein
MREDLRALRSVVDAVARDQALMAERRASMPEKVAVARPTGVGRGITTYTIPIEGRDEWLAAAMLA